MSLSLPLWNKHPEMSSLRPNIWALVKDSLWFVAMVLLIHLWLGRFPFAIVIGWLIGGVVRYLFIFSNIGSLRYSDNEVRRGLLRLHRESTLEIQERKSGKVIIIVGDNLERHTFASRFYNPEDWEKLRSCLAGWKK